MDISSLLKSVLPPFVFLSFFCHSACALVDGSGSHVGLTVYNLADSTHFNIGDIITIPDPHFKKVQLDADKVPNHCSAHHRQVEKALASIDAISYCMVCSKILVS